MKKKVLYGIFMALFAVVSMGSLQSCKDDMEDKLQQQQYDVATLRTEIDKLKAEVKADMEECKAELDKKVDKTDFEAFKLGLSDYLKLNLIWDKLNDLQNQIDSKVCNCEDLSGAIAALEGRVGDVETLAGELNSRLTDIDIKVTEIEAITEGLDEKYALKSEVKELSDKYDALENRVKDAEDAIEGLKLDIVRIDDDLATVWAKFEANDLFVTQLYNLVTDGFADVDSAIEEIYQRIELNEQEMTMIYNQVVDLQNEMTELKEQIKSDNEDIWSAIRENQETMTQMLNLISDLNNRIDEFSGVKDRLNKLITGIIVQGTYNPLFGTFSLPLGVRSNMLFNWYGYNGEMTYSFPTSNNVVTYDREDPALTNADLAFLAPEKFELKKGEYLTEGNLGRVYLTVNPVGVDFSGATFNMETSDGTRLPYELKPIKESTENLTFGYQRSAANGFYEADVIMPATEEAITATKIYIEPGLKSTAKDFIKNATRRNAVDLLKAVYSEMSSALPAFALRADWSSQDGNGAVKNYAVLSQYDMAVTTARPLSYAFYEGQGQLTSRRLPNIGTLHNLFDRLIGDRDKYHFDLSGYSIDLKPFKIEFDGFDISFSTDINYEGGLSVTIKPINIYDANNPDKLIGSSHPSTAEVDPKNLDEFITCIENAINEAVNNPETGLASQLNGQLKDELIDKINEQVQSMLDNVKSEMEKMMADMEGEINGKIDDILNDFAGKVDRLSDKFNRFIDIYNKFANQFNRILANPNAYLQPALFYTNHRGVSVVSTKASDPTVFSVAGGDAICLYASSYSAEIIAPAYKKFVAVTNVYKDGKKLDRDQYADMIKGINAESKVLNKVISGGSKRIPIATSKMQSGLTYEIVYQGVDYEARTSTRKFYIKVK